MYPGDEYVDVLGLDGFNGGSTLDWGGWLSPTQVFDYSVRLLAGISSKPIWLCEVASSEVGGDKARWIADLWSYVGAHPQIEAVVWFNERREVDWRVESSNASLAAIRATPAAL